MTFEALARELRITEARGRRETAHRLRSESGAVFRNAIATGRAHAIRLRIRAARSRRSSCTIIRRSTSSRTSARYCAPSTATAAAHRSILPETPALRVRALLLKTQDLRLPNKRRRDWGHKFRSETFNKYSVSNIPTPILNRV